MMLIYYQPANGCVLDGGVSSKEKMSTKKETAGFICIVVSGVLATQLAGFKGFAVVLLGVIGTAVYISGLLKDSEMLGQLYKTS